MKKDLFSYLYGIFITDGNLYLASRNRGRITLEISYKDKDLIDNMYKLIPKSIIRERIRNTNFKKNYYSYIFVNNQLNFRNIFIEAGFPLKNKTEMANYPNVKYLERDYWRGIIDGDGSIGFTINNEPFVSLVTKSEILKNEFIKFININFGIIKNLNRNKRDKVYNFIIKNENAIKLVNYLYSENDILHLNRKYEKVKEIQKWERTRKKKNRRSFSQQDIDFIKKHTICECIKELRRTEKSIKMKKFRLNKLLNI